jgi:hypothetical protein
MAPMMAVQEGSDHNVMLNSAGARGPTSCLPDWTPRRTFVMSSMCMILTGLESLIEKSLWR